MQEKQATINVSTSVQQKLIQLVYVKGKQMKTAANKLKLKYSRAKKVIKHYQETGKYLPETVTQRFPRTHKVQPKQENVSQNYPLPYPQQNHEEPRPVSERRESNQQEEEARELPKLEAQPEQMFYIIYHINQWNPF